MLVFADSFDHYAASNILQKWTSNLTGTLALAGPGRIGYGQYLNASATAQLYKGISTLTTVIVGFAFYYNSGALTNQSIFGFLDNAGATLGTINVTASGQVGYVSGAGNWFSSPGILTTQAWCYIECEVVLSNSGTGSVTVRFNGVTVKSQGSITTAQNGNGCSLLGPAVGSGNPCFFDDLYVLNTTSPNNTFLGDTKIICLFPAGNGRVNGFSRFGGTASGNWTAVNENPPDGDSSYVYTATPGTEDCYTLTTLSNVQTVQAVQLCGYARKDDTPSRVLSLGIGDGATEHFDAGTSLNTSYTYVLRQLDQDPVTSASWVAANFASRQLCVELVS